MLTLPGHQHGHGVIQQVPLYLPHQGTADQLRPIRNDAGSLYDISTYGTDFRAPYAENIQLSVERRVPVASRRQRQLRRLAGAAQPDHLRGNSDTPAGHAACVPDPVYNLPDVTRNYQTHLLSRSHLPSTTRAHLPVWARSAPYASSSYHSLQANVQKGTDPRPDVPPSPTPMPTRWIPAPALRTPASARAARAATTSSSRQLNYGDSAYRRAPAASCSHPSTSPRSSHGSRPIDPLNLRALRLGDHRHYQRWQPASRTTSPTPAAPPTRSGARITPTSTPAPMCRNRLASRSAAI